MKRIALLLTGAVMGVGFAHNALAADLPVRAPAYVPPVVVAPTWTGRLPRFQRRLGLDQQQ